MSRMDVISFKEKKGGGYFAIRVGSAVPGKKDGEINIYLDAIPAPVDGQYRLSVVHQRPKGEQPSGGVPAGPGRDDMSDEVPW